MKLGVLSSGGKDSIFTLHKCVEAGHEIKYLITVFPSTSNSWMFHYPCVEITELQSKALGLKLIKVKTSGEKEKEIQDLKKALTKIKNKIEGLAFGAIASTYQKTRIDKLCEEIELKSLSPLWQLDQEKILREEANLMEIIIVGVYSEGLDKNWLGKRIDNNSVKNLIEISKTYGFSPTGEGGDYETAVLDAPLFNKKIVIESWLPLWHGMSGFIKIDKMFLKNK